jgi:hypothetical protein
MVRPILLLRRPIALVVAIVAVTDVAYRIIVREQLRRVLGIEH